MWGKVRRWLRWGAAVGVSVVLGGVGAVVGLYAGLYLRSLLAALFLAWAGFTVFAYVTLLMMGFALRLKVAGFLLRGTR